MIELYRDLLRHLAKKANTTLITAEGEVAVALKPYSKELPVDFHRVLTTSWPAESMAAPPYELFSLSEIVNDDSTEPLAKKGFFQIGRTGNGDMLVLRLGNKWAYETPVCLVSHELYFSEDTPLDQCVVEVSESFSEFLYRAVEERYLPIDFFCAQEFWKLKQKHGPEKPPSGT